MTPPAPITTTDRLGRYTPDVPDREPSSDWFARWWEHVCQRPTEVIALAIAAGAVLAGLGLQFTIPSARLASETQARIATDSALTQRVATLEHRFDTLSDRLTFTDFLLCEGLQSNPSPTIAPQARTNCNDIIRERLAP